MAEGPCSSSIVMEGQSSSSVANVEAGRNVVELEVILEDHVIATSSDTLETSEPPQEQSEPPASARGVTEDLRSELIFDSPLRLP